MGNFIENTLGGIGNAVSGLFGGSRGSGSSRPSVGQQVQDAAKQKAMADRYDEPTKGDLTEAQMDDLRAKTMRDPRSMPGTSGGFPMKKGGSVSARADGIAQRGKTKGRIV